MKSILIIAILLTGTLLLTGFTNPDQAGEFPGDYNLFKIDRSPDQDIMMYDVRLYNISETMADFQLVAYKDRVFQLRKNDDENYRVYTVAGDRDIELKSLYIHFEDNSFWFPEISSIELKGVDIVDGGMVTETIIPKSKKD